jgi:hypothetical protein
MADFHSLKRLDPRMVGGSYIFVVGKYLCLLQVSLTALWYCSKGANTGIDPHELKSSNSVTTLKDIACLQQPMQRNN